MTAPKRKRWLWFFLLVPFIAAPLALRLYVPRVADRVARELGKLARPISDAGSDSASDSGAAPPSAPDSASDSDSDAGSGSVPAPAPTRTAARPSPRSRDASAERSSIFIPKATVAREAARAQKAVSARNAVLPDGTRGVALRGVGAFGAGLADGDVITSIEGRPTPDVDAAMQAITSAVAGGAHVVHGTIRRGARVYEVTLELPDPQP